MKHCSIVVASHTRETVASEKIYICRYIISVLRVTAPLAPVTLQAVAKAGASPEILSRSLGSARVAALL